MRFNCLFIIALAICSSGADARYKVAPSEECNNGRLRKSVLTPPQEMPGRARELERLLACLGPTAAPLTAANAAYELAMHHAGADGGTRDFRAAATWARRSVDYLKRVHVPDLRRKTRLAAIRLDYYAAETAAELQAVARDLDALVVSCRIGKDADAQCAESLKLFGDVQRDLSGKGNAQSSQRAINAFRRFLQTRDGEKRGPDRASALVDKGTLIAQAPEGSLTSEEIDEAVAALREATEFFRNERDEPRERLAQVNLGAVLAGRRSAHAASLDEAERLLRPLVESSDTTISPAIRLTAQRNLGSVLAKKQTGNHQKNLDEAIVLLRAAHAAVSKNDVRNWIKTGENLALVLQSSGLKV